MVRIDCGPGGVWTWDKTIKRFVHEDGERFRTREDMNRGFLYALEGVPWLPGVAQSG